MPHRFRRPLVVGFAALAVGTTVLSGCSSQRGGGGETTAAADVDSTFIFGASGDPAGLDPAFASDGETFRVTRQIFEGLVGTEPGTADPAPLLAKSWTVSDDGLTYTFELQDGVTFQDGTPFDADAVCFNFDRQYNFTGLAQSQSLSYYWGTLMRGFKDTGNSLYSGCATNGDHEAIITLTAPYAGFIPALSLPSFAIQSPTALAKYNADDVGGTEDAPTYSEYATSHPVGTGPFEFVSSSPGEQVELKAYPDYWGDQGQVQDIIFRVIGDTTARRQALESGSIDGYDLVAPADVDALKGSGYTLINRDPFNILYLGMNQAVPALADIRVRQAIAYAIDKQALVSQVLPQGTTPADEFMPDSVIGFNADVTTYAYDPDKAKSLLAEAGYTAENPLTVQFNYPTNISRPYMPNPEQIFTVLSSQLQAVGIQVTPATDEWVPYRARITGGTDHGLHLLGWTGDYNDPYNFVGTFFGGPTMEWGFDNQQLFTDLTKASELATTDEQDAAYQKINEEIAQFVPGIPLASPVPTLAFNSRVTSYPASPVQDEVYNQVTLSK